MFKGEVALLSKVLIVAVRDPRKRIRFLLEPLVFVGAKPSVIYDEGLGFYYQALKTMFRRYSHLIVIGGNFKNLIWFVVAKLIGAVYVLRLGGNPLVSEKSKLSLYRKDRRYYLFIKYYINYYCSKFLLRNSEKIIVVNKCIADDLKGVIVGAVYVVPQFVTIPDIDLTENLQVNNEINCLCVTNLNYMEKAEALVKLIIYLNAYCNIKTDIKIIFDIAGGGGFEDIVFDAIKQVDNPNNLIVNFHGYIDDVSCLYKKADIFLYASEIDGTPNSILEAKSYALPVIVNRLPPFESIFLSKETQLYFDLESKDDFEKKLDFLIGNEKERKKVGSLNRREVKSYFSQEAVGRKLKEVLGF